MDNCTNEEHPIGIVKGIENGEVIITFTRSSACESCNACGLVKETGDMLIKMPLKDQVKTGDLVKIIVERSFFLTSALLLYGIPLIVLMAAIGLGSILFGSELGQVITAIVGFLLASGSYFLLRLFKDRFSQMKANNMTYERVD